MDSIDMLLHSLFGPKIRITTFNRTSESAFFMLELDMVMECSVTLEQLVTGVTLVPDLFVNRIDNAKKT